MTPSTTTEPVKRRSGWRMLGLMVLGMVLLAIGGGFWWYSSDSDLEAVRQQARLQGRPLSWSEMGLKPADPERLRMWKRVTELTAQLKSYQTIQYDPRKLLPVINLWDPIPQEVRDYHQSLDSAAIPELIELLDRLGDQPLLLHDQYTFETSFYKIDKTGELLSFLQERMLLAESADTGAWGRRLLATCRRYSSDSIGQHTIRTILIMKSLGGIVNRLTDLKKTDPNIAADILTTIQPSHAHLLHVLDGEFIITLDRFSRRAHYPGNYAWISMPLFSRSGREGALLSLLDERHELQSLDEQSSLAWARSAEAKFRTAQGRMLYLNVFHEPSTFLRGFFLPSWRVISMEQRTALHGRLIAAELQGQPWPIDTFDASGATLRPIIRDGRVIAAYSVGDDGKDQGGDERNDLIFPLYAKP